MVIIASAVCGLIFGAGLLISGMLLPTKILAFLDIFGSWDPTLLIVMIAALAVSVPGFRLAQRRSQPIFAASNFLPAKNRIDLPLVVGAALFGIGWGLVGLCPGPALENLATLSPQIIVFVAAMAGGMGLHFLWQRSQTAVKRDAVLANAIDG
jgi:uncharacterized membrane protein YedE/YeeE